MTLTWLAFGIGLLVGYILGAVRTARLHRKRRYVDDELEQFYEQSRRAQLQRTRTTGGT